MNVTPTAIDDVLIIEPEIHGDHRGYFMETWRQSAFKQLGIDLEFVQDNQSSSRQGILRGLHYQLHNPQGKLVRAIDGEIYDVAVDLRKTSATFGRWVGVTLSAENRRQLWVPPGFAHGFYVTSTQAQIVYKCTAYYDAGDEHCLKWDDPQIAINWPVEVAEPVLSEKDSKGSLLKDAMVFS